jgi:hypothetical protein
MAVILDYGLRLPVHRMVKPALERSDHGGGSWGWMRNGDYYAKISYWIARQGPREALLRLSYTRDVEAVAYDVRLVAVPCRFGGLRWFAICPATWLKVSKLYLPPGARRFLARKAWRLAYASQHVAPGFDRLCAQRDRLLSKKLKSDDPDFPLKPKGMRWRTYERHLDKLEYLQTAMDLAILQRFGMTAEAILNNSGNLDREE